VTTGQPAVEKVTGMPVFEYFAGNPDYSALFNNAMTAFSAAVIPAVLAAYDFSGIDTLVDVAGGHGHVLTSILRKYPAMRGVLFDLDHVVAGAGPLLQGSGVGDRVRAESGDFFTAVPPGDAYIMKHIIHDQDEVWTIADRVAVMQAGRILQAGSLDEVWRAPVSGAAALLLGYPTILEGAAAQLLAGAGEHPDVGSVGAIALRRSALRLDPAGRLGGRVVAATLSPDVVRLRVLVEGLGEMHAVAQQDSDVRIDHEVRLAVDLTRTAVLPAASPAR
jgi:hypothetical protein